MNVKCPACKKEYPTTLSCARHIFGTGDKAHRQWVESQGHSYIDLLLAQISEPGNKSYDTLKELIDKAQPNL